MSQLSPQAALLDVAAWRAGGAALWSGLLVVWAALSWCLSWGSIPSLRPWRLLAPMLQFWTWGVVSALLTACAPLLALHILMLRAEAPKPLIGNGGAVSSVLGRLRSVQGVVSSGLYLAASIGCGMSFMVAFAPLRCSGASLDWRLSATSGAVLGLIHAVRFFTWNRDVVSFPVVQRARIFRVKQRLPAAASSAAVMSLLAVIASAVVSRALGPRVSSARGVMVALLGASLLQFSWELVALVVEVVFSERIQFARYGGANALSTLQHALKNSKESLAQELAHLDICLLAEQGGGSSWLREVIFTDQMGTTWSSLATPCLTEVKALITSILSSLPGKQGAGETSGENKDAKTAISWNTGAMAPKPAMSSSNRSASASCHMRLRYHRIQLCIRTLSALVASSLKEDRYGILQLHEPSLGECVSSLLSALAILKQHTRRACSAPPRKTTMPGQMSVPWLRNAVRLPALSSGEHSMHEVDMPAHCLEDVARTGVNRLVDAFGESLLAVLRTNTTSPMYGSRPELEALVKGAMDSPF